MRILQRDISTQCIGFFCSLNKVGLSCARPQVVGIYWPSWVNNFGVFVPFTHFFSFVLFLRFLKNCVSDSANLFAQQLVFVAYGIKIQDSWGP